MDDPCTRDVIPLAANDIHLVMQNDISVTRLGFHGISSLQCEKSPTDDAHKAYLGLFIGSSPTGLSGAPSRSQEVFLSSAVALAHSGFVTVWGRAPASCGRVGRMASVEISRRYGHSVRVGLTLGSRSLRGLRH